MPCLVLFLRGCYFKSGGVGKSKAVWNTTLQKKGKYRVMVKIYEPVRLALNNGILLEGVVYYYMVDCGGNRQESVQVCLDEVDFGLRNSKWVSLGEFEF